ncbi:type II toxin-antitoxin system CcdA family antitoxin [Exiguobacterium flavidum]|uniref:CopG family transcriptional regulator n=1 Tax=Exiguobacterium flavidum TaxID=2184695 RepID=UPI000DF7803D|nr:CopG family transcriptional regulator [Exiguobacterium flavidum]
MANEKKRISLTVDADFDQLLTKKAKAIGVPKSTLVTFATSLFLKQLQAEEILSPNANGIYSLIRQNHDIVSDIKEMMD